MTERQQALYDEAKSRYGDISPCGGRPTWDGCFTDYKGDLMIWFDINNFPGERKTTGALSERHLNSSAR